MNGPLNENVGDHEYATGKAGFPGSAKGVREQ